MSRDQLALSLNLAIILAREQALHLGDIVKSSRARGTREETRTRVRTRERKALLFSAPRGFAAPSRFLARKLGIFRTV